MKPIHFPEANSTLTRPPEMEPDQCDDLPVCRTYQEGTGHWQMVSCWQPTEEERQRIAAGAPIYLGVLGALHPPVWLDLDPFLSNEPAGAEE